MYRAYDFYQILSSRIIWIGIITGAYCIIASKNADYSETLGMLTQGRNVFCGAFDVEPLIAAAHIIEST